MIDHVGMQVVDFNASARFYDAALEPLGFTRLMEFGPAIGYGVDGKPFFWINQLDPDGDSSGFRESHIAFMAADRTAVDAFFVAATGVGAEVLHAPREWPEYHPGYYGAFVRDPDGNNVEAVCHRPA